MAELFRYAAFISYSSKDAVFARRLHRALESYGIPSSLGQFDLIGGGKKNRIYPVFRDREELSAGHLGDLIEANLRAAAALIVVCSPNCAASPWVQKEIEYFAALGRREKIFAIITDTSPIDDGVGKDATALCFPPAFRGDALSGDTLEPLAADARVGKDGFRNAWLKIVAGLIGVSPGQLIDRDKRRQRANALRTTVLVLGAVIAVTLSASWLVSNQLQARSDSLAELARVASNEQQFERAARYARAGLSGWDQPLIGFRGAAAESELRHAAAGSRLEVVLRGHEDRVWSATFSEDGRRVLTVSDDDTARIWDAATGRQVAILHGRRGHRDQFLVAAFSSDGTRVVTAIERTVRVWNAENGRELAALPQDTFASMATFSPDGTNLVTVPEGPIVRVWHQLDATSADWREVAAFRHQSFAVNAAFSPDGSRVIVSYQDGSARIWDVRSGRQILALTGHAGWVTSAEFSPDGARVVTAGGVTARVWDAITGRAVATLPLDGEIARARFIADGRMIATVTSAFRTMRVWVPDTGREIETLRLEGYIEVTPDGTRAVASAGSDVRLVALGRTPGGQPIWSDVAMLRGQQGSLLGASFSPRGDRLVTALADGTARIWDSSSWLERRAFHAHDDAARAVDFNRDGSEMVTASDDHTARIWSLSGRGEWREMARLEGHEGVVRTAAFSVDGARIVTASDDASARVWNARNRTIIATLQSEHALRDAEFNRDGTRILTASTDNTARVWEASSGRQLAVLVHDTSVEAATFSPDGTRIATGSDDGVVRIWARATGEDWREVMSLRSQEDGRMQAGVGLALAFSPDGRRIISSTRDSIAEIWDTRDGRKIIALRGDEGWVRSAGFSPDGARVITASGSTARVWEAATGREIMVMRHGDWVNEAVFTRDGASAVTASSDGNVHIWSLDAALFAPRRDLFSYVCRTTLPDGIVSRFSPGEMQQAPLNPMLDVDACHPPSLWDRLIAMGGPRQLPAR
jgi:WD40 repeat protein